MVFLWVMIMDFLPMFYTCNTRLELLWKRRGVDERTIQVIHDVIKQNTIIGLNPKQECVAVAYKALTYLGLKYFRSEELREETIDCSTLTSQAHWEGGLIGIPFTAEGQRNAQTARSIEFNNILPGDVVIKYSSIMASPSCIFNHVGMVLDWSSNYSIWIIESNEENCCVISLLEDFVPAGGIRRFCPEPLLEFDTLQARETLSLAPLVPKLGRLGAKQHTRFSFRLPHRGIDIYVPKQTPIYAPISGKVLRCTLDNENSPAILILDENRDARVLLGHVEPIPSVTGQSVSAGTLVGNSVPPSQESAIFYSTCQQNNTHVHFEYATPLSSLDQLGDLLMEGWLLRNGLYAAKTGAILSPIRLNTN